MSITPNTTFSWKNYTKPTPRNLERIAGAVRDLFAGIAAFGYFAETHILSLVMAFLILLTGQAVKFFASVREEEERESVTAEFPSGKEITITQDKNESNSN